LSKKKQFKSNLEITFFLFHEENFLKAVCFTQANKNKYTKPLINRNRTFAQIIFLNADF